MSFLSSSFANSKPSYTSRASEPIQVNSVAVLKDLFTVGFPGSFRCAAISQLFQARWNFIQFVAKSPVSSNFEDNGMVIGICTRFGCVTASCTCTEAPLPSGLGLKIFSGLCSSSVTAALALMTVIAQLLLWDK